MRGWLAWDIRNLAPLAGLAIFVVLAAGCVTTPPQEAPENWPEPLGDAVPLQPGDVIDVKFAYYSELDQEDLNILPDGTTSLPLLGYVPAAGLSPGQLGESLETAYAGKINYPELRVLVKQFNSRHVFVAGEVAAPQVVLMADRLSILDAIMQCGGFIKWSAQQRNVVLIRQRDGKRYARSFNLRKALEESESESFYLEPFDIVFVPRTKIEKLDQWMDQYVDKVLGRRSLHGNYNLNQSLDGTDSGGVLTQPFQFQPILP